jgi:hypothetical protein
LTPCPGAFSDVFLIGTPKAPGLPKFPLLFSILSIIITSALWDEVFAPAAIGGEKRRRICQFFLVSLSISTIFRRKEK